MANGLVWVGTNNEGLRDPALVNPLVPVIDGYRRTVLEGLRPEWDLLALGAAGALAYLVGGYAAFRRFQGGIADVA